VEPAELPEIADDHEVFRVLLGMLPPQPSLEKREHENECMIRTVKGFFSINNISIGKCTISQKVFIQTVVLSI